MKVGRKPAVVCFAAALLGILPLPGAAQESDVSALERQLVEQERRLAEQQAQLARQQEELRKMRETLYGLSEIRAAGSGLRVAQAAPEGTVGQRPRAETTPPVVAPITDAVSVLTPRRRFVLEPSFQYAHSSDSRVALTGFTIIPALTIGLIDIRSVERDMWVAALTGRYGVTDRLELEAKVPWVYRNDSTLARPLNVPTQADSQFESSGSGLGDIELAARYQMTLRPPFYIGYLRFKSRTGDGPFDVVTSTPQPGLAIEEDLPTGSGFYSLQPGLTAIVPSDPAVFFGGVSYIWNVRRDVDTLDLSGTPIGRYDPGDGVNFNFGMGLSINERASFSLGYDHSTFRRDKRNGQYVENTQTQQLGSLLFGLAYRLDAKTNFNVVLGVGATRAAPDVQLTLRVPVGF